MTKEQIKHLEETVTMPSAMLTKDSAWQEAFKEYNEDVKKYKKLKKTKPFLGGQTLQTGCMPCYPVVLRYLKSKQK